jgi:hypothetical protein
MKIANAILGGVACYFAQNPALSRPKFAGGFRRCSVNAARCSRNLWHSCRNYVRHRRKYTTLILLIASA